MTLLEIEILSHYRCSAADYRNGDHTAPAVREALDRFLRDGLLTHKGFHVERFVDGTLKARYEATERTVAYLEALQSVPLPEQVWTMPKAWRCELEAS